MPFGATRIIDLDSHLVGDIEHWPEFIEDAWRSYLPRFGSGEGGERDQKPNWFRPEDLTPEGRVRNLDKDGIDVAVLSPNSGALDRMWRPDDPQLAAAFCRTQNNYMAHFASHYPERFKWAGGIPLQDRDEAVQELNRMAELGSKGVNMKAVPVMGREWWDPYYEPVWTELERLGLPLIFRDTKQGSLGYERFRENFFFSHMVGRVIETMVCTLVFICGGILERHPGLKVIALEMGASQMPWWLGRMDEHFEKLGNLVPWLETRPSEIFKRQVYLGCEPFEDPLFEWAVETLGDDNLVLATDQPHWDSIQPGGAIKPVLESTRFSDSTKQKVLGGNAAALMRL